MAVNDILLRKKVQLKKAASKPAKALSKVTTIGSSVSTAIKQTTYAKKSNDELILSVLDFIDSATKNTVYPMIDQEIPSGQIKKVADYFVKKKYIVAIAYKRNSTQELIIYWGGGKKWRKAQDMESAPVEDLGMKCINEVLDFIKDIDPYARIEFLNPSLRMNYMGVKAWQQMGNYCLKLP